MLRVALQPMSHDHLAYLAALPFSTLPAEEICAVDEAEHLLRRHFPYSTVRSRKAEGFRTASRFVQLDGIGLHVGRSRGFSTWTPDPPPAFGMVMHLSGA